MDEQIQTQLNKQMFKYWFRHLKLAVSTVTIKSCYCYVT